MQGHFDAALPILPPRCLCGYSFVEAELCLYRRFIVRRPFCSLCGLPTACVCLQNGVLFICRKLQTSAHNLCLFFVKIRRKQSCKGV